jgi:hypothetical protein
MVSYSCAPDIDTALLVATTALPAPHLGPGGSLEHYFSTPCTATTGSARSRALVRATEDKYVAADHLIYSSSRHSPAQLFFTSFLSEAALAFGAGIRAANPCATGTYTWSGISYVQSSVTYTFLNGDGSSVGGAWTPLAWAIWVAVTVLVGRLWRLVPLWRRRRAALTQHA